MFSTSTSNETDVQETINSTKNKTPPNIYTQMNYKQHHSENKDGSTTRCHVSSINTILEHLVTEKQHNKTETWNKLNKTMKIQKLNIYAEKYGKEHSLPMKEIRELKSFLFDCLEKGKLQKVKDVICDKESREITSIPALIINTHTHNFTLRVTDNKRVSTLKSLPPPKKKPSLVVVDSETGIPPIVTLPPQSTENETDYSSFKKEFPLFICK